MRSSPDKQFFHYHKAYPEAEKYQAAKILLDSLFPTVSTTWNEVAQFKGFIEENEMTQKELLKMIVKERHRFHLRDSNNKGPSGI